VARSADEALAAANHDSWFAAQAAATGGSVAEVADVRVALEGGGAPHPSLLFPAFAAGDEGRAALDAVTARCRAAPGLAGVGVWSLAPPQPPELGAWMLARGYNWGWRPHWMVLDLAAEPPAPDPPAGVRLGTIHGPLPGEPGDVPYYSPADGRLAGLLAAAEPRAAWGVAAWQGDRPVGRAVVHVAAGDPPHAGLYSMGVAPDVQRRGIGTALVGAAAAFAAGEGGVRITLNSTHAGRPLYRAAGFASVGDGQTWWMPQGAAAGPPSPPGEVAFVEALATGDLDRLDALAPGLAPGDLDRRYPCTLTQAEMALKTGQEPAVAWLEARGATIDLLTAWDVGWGGRLPELAGRHPGLADAPVDDHGTRPLHQAIQRGDAALVAALLAAGADPTIPDGTYRSDALGWASHLGEDECAALIAARHPAPGR
jgi:GNAT superfamily N-acetyltransferase